MTDLEKLLIQGLFSLFTAITTLLAVWLALRRFYREKWWEAKMQAYSNIIEALHHMNRDLEITIKAEYEGRDTETDYFKEWGKKHAAAWDEIRKQVDVGEFLFSSASVKILRDLLSCAESDPSELYVEHLESLQARVEKCMPAIKASARKDLGLPALKIEL